MTADEVVAVLDRLADAGVEVWVDGGWGIDALLGEQGRAHADLDLTVPTPGLDLALELLAADGFVVYRDERPTSIALRHPDGREVDLHPLIPSDDGGGDQVLPDGGLWHYEPPAWGTVAGRRCRCLAPVTQWLAHQGFELRPEHHDDLRRLRERFDVGLPPFDG